MAQITGIVKVYVGGALMQSLEGAKLMTGGMERVAKTGNGVVLGYAEKTVPAQVEFTIVHTALTDLQEINDLAGVTVKFETDTGTSYLIDNAFTTKPTELTGGEGEVVVEMQGEPALQE